MNKIRELLELPDKWQKESEEGLVRNIYLLNCANELQSALEAADIQGLVDRVEAAELAVKECHLQEDEVTLIYELAQMRKRVEQLEAQQWQPIEGAPRDGTVIDIWTPSDGRITECWWDAEFGYWEMDSVGHYRDCYVTHWMPLPSAPQEQKDE